jgi:hypothetical protein
MSRSQTMLNSLVRVRQNVAEIQSTDETGAVLTLTRTSAQAITTAGTVIIWQSEIRGYEITWAGSDITIPASGWYIVACAFQFGALNDLLIRLVVNGVGVQFASTIGDVNRDVATCTFMRYFAESDVVRIQLEPSANVNVNARAEGITAESPILHIVQLSGDVDV